MPVRVYIATTKGPVAIERITREPVAASVVCLQRTTKALSMSAGYDAFVKGPTGPIERDFGPYPPGAFRLDVSSEIGPGDSWQLAVYTAHALAAEGALADPETEIERAILLTGEVLNDLTVQPVGMVSDKILSAKAEINRLSNDAVPTTIFMHPDNIPEVDPADLPSTLDLTGVERADEVCRALGLRKSGVHKKKLSLSAGAMIAASATIIIVTGAIIMSMTDRIVPRETPGLASADAKIPSKPAPDRSGARPDRQGAAKVVGQSMSPYLPASELRRRLTGTFIKGRTPRGISPVFHFRPHGDFTGYVRGRSDNGRWWVEHDGFTCIQYERWLGGDQKCWYMKMEANRFKLFKLDGTPVNLDWEFTSGPPAYQTDFSISGDPCSSPRLKFHLNGVLDKATEALKSDFCHALGKVEAWWGNGFAGEIRVAVDDRYRDSQALALAWAGEPGRIETMSNSANTRVTSAISLVMQAYAPNQNRFLATGLGVFAQIKLKGNPAFPTFGNDLHLAAAGHQDFVKKPILRYLDDIAVPEPLVLEGHLNAPAAATFAGSFVRFLFERFGMDKFRRLYGLTPLRPGETGGAGRPDRWQQIYGATLDELEDDWWLYLQRYTGDLQATQKALSTP